MRFTMRICPVNIKRENNNRIMYYNLFETFFSLFKNKNIYKLSIILFSSPNPL